MNTAAGFLVILSAAGAIGAAGWLTESFWVDLGGSTSEGGVSRTGGTYSWLPSVTPRNRRSDGSSSMMRMVGLSSAIMHDSA